jgi:hypothetical protein
MHQSHENDRSHFPYMAPALVAPVALAVTAPQKLVAALDSQSATLSLTALIKSALDDPGRPPQLAVADSKQE